jgi:hypothetical protein
MRHWQFLPFVLLASPVLGQRVEYGAKIGWQVNRPVPSAVSDDSARVMAGPLVGVKLWGPVSAEFSLTTRLLGYSLGAGDTKTQMWARVLDIPVQARIEGPERSGVKPFISGGYVRRMGRLTGRASGIAVAGLTEWWNGGAVGGGISFKVGRARIEPEYRYTHIRNWMFPQQAHDLMVGFRF